MQVKRKMIVRSSTQVAEIWRDDECLRVYKISTAAKRLGCEEGSYCTPEGSLRVASKIGEDLPLGAVLKARVHTGEIWSSEIANPLSSSTEDLVLTRILWLEGTEEKNLNTLQRYIYLHGTNYEHLLGTPVSHGCIRFRNKDIVEVFKLLEVGDEVKVI